MITQDGVMYISNGTPRTIVTLYGLSTDTKPTTGIINGSKFIEMDKGKEYYFNAAAEAGSEWVEWKQEEPEPTPEVPTTEVTATKSTRTTAKK